MLDLSPFHNLLAAELPSRPASRTPLPEHTRRLSESSDLAGHDVTVTWRPAAGQARRSSSRTAMWPAASGRPLGGGGGGGLITAPPPRRPTRATFTDVRGRGDGRCRER